MEARPSAASENESSLSDLLAPLVYFKRYIIVFCMSAVLSSLALTYVFSEKYQAATTIVFQPQEVTRLREKAALAFGAPLPIAPWDLIYDNLLLLVQSELILLQVVEDFGLHLEAKKDYSGPWYISLFKKTKDWVKKLRDNTWTILKYGRLVADGGATAALKGVREHLALIDNNSYVFYLTFVDNDPQRAALIVDRIAEYIVASLLESQRVPGVLKGQQLSLLKAEKEAEMEGYLTEIENLLLSNHTASISLEVERTMKQYSELSLTRVQLSAKIASTMARLDAINARGINRPGASKGLHPDDYRLLRSREIDISIQLTGLRKEYSTLLEAIENLEFDMAKLPRVQFEFDMLMQKLKTAQRDYIQVSDPYHEAQIQANSVMSEVYLPHKARVPSVPIAPIKIYHVSLTAGLAVSLAFGFAYLLAFAKSEEVSRAVSRAVSNVASRWDGVNRRQGNQPPYTGVDRRAAREIEADGDNDVS